MIFLVLQASVGARSGSNGFVLANHYSTMAERMPECPGGGMPIGKRQPLFFSQVKALTLRLSLAYDMKKGEAIVDILSDWLGGPKTYDSVSSRFFRWNFRRCSAQS